MAVRSKKDASGNIIPGEFIIDIRPAGRKGPRARIPFHGTEIQARDFELQLLREFKGSARAQISPTFLDALPEFLAAYRNEVAKTTATDFHWAWKQLEKTFGKIPIANLTPNLIETYKAKRLEDGVKKRTINRELSYLSAILKWAEDQHIIRPLPFRVKRFPKKQTVSPIPVVHTPAEIQEVLKEVNPKKLTIALLLYDAGLRRAEACNLTGAQVDLAAGIIRVKGKGGKERLVPIHTNRLRSALKESIAECGKGELFINPATGRPYKDIRRALRAASERADIDKPIYHHLLRHDHGTHAALAEVDPRAVQQLLGHSNLSTTELYTHIAGEFLKTQGAKFAALVDEAQTVDLKKTKKDNKDDDLK